MTKYPANTKPVNPNELIDPKRPQSKGDQPRWIMRVRFLFYRLVSPFVKAEIYNSLWEDKRVD